MTNTVFIVYFQTQRYLQFFYTSSSDQKEKTYYEITSYCCDLHTNHHLSCCTVCNVHYRHLKGTRSTFCIIFDWLFKFLFKARRVNLPGLTFILASLILFLHIIALHLLSNVLFINPDSFSRMFTGLSLELSKPHKSLE